MLRVFLINLILIGVVGYAIGANKYCSAKLCPSGVKHIACGNDGNFAASCPSNARLINIRQYKKFILNLYNTKRNFIASGRLRGYRSARHMATMRWSNELAKLAALNVKQCRIRHDKCRNTAKYAHSGQNLASLSFTGSYKRKSIKNLIRNRMDAWWNEYKNANMRIIRRYPSGYKGPAIGHFTVFVNERNVRVGCAASRYKIGRNNNFLIACNYATTNIVGKSSYRSGRAGASCRTGRNKVFKSLCSKAEKYTGLK